LARAAGSASTVTKRFDRGRDATWWWTNHSVAPRNATRRWTNHSAGAAGGALTVTERFDRGGDATSWWTNHSVRAARWASAVIEIVGSRRGSCLDRDQALRPCRGMPLRGGRTVPSRRGMRPGGEEPIGPRRGMPLGGGRTVPSRRGMRPDGESRFLQRQRGFPAGGRTIPALRATRPGDGRSAPSAPDQGHSSASRSHRIASMAFASPGGNATSPRSTRGHGGARAQRRAPRAAGRRRCPERCSLRRRRARR
jgi:hypothetical protein